MSGKGVVVGIDLGSDVSFVSFVAKGGVDVVQNEVSKRATPTLVGFTDRERLLGDAALSQIKSNCKNTCRNFKHLLGQKLDAPLVAEEHFWSTSALGTAADGCAGYEVTYKGETSVQSATEVAAAYLTKLRDVTEAWCEAKMVDVVIGVPAYYSDVHRQALLDAAKIANISVLRLLNEHTATALGYGIYRSNDFDAEKPMTVAFCSLGHTIFSVCIAQFIKGKLNIICECHDKVGGRDMDKCLMTVFAGEFEKKFGCNPLKNKKACFKLEDAVTKCKKILSANYEATVGAECLMEDQDLSSSITREDFLKMCEPMMARVKAVLDKAIKIAGEAGVTVDMVDFVEVIGGSSRVPWFKEMVSKAFNDKPISTTMNADESVARGCALQAAILSPLYKVRDFAVSDVSPYPVSISYMGTSDAAGTQEADGDMQMTAADGECKTTVLFPMNSATNLMKQMTFNRKGPFELKAQYADATDLVPGTQMELGSFKIELPPQQETKKVQVRSKLSLHGIFVVESATLIEEEEYDETVKEKRELPEEEGAEETKSPASPSPSPDAEAPKDGDEPMPAATEGAEGEKAEEGAKDAKAPEKKKEKKYEWVEVVKRKKRTKKTELKISRTGVAGLPDATIQKLMDAETKIQTDMREIVDTDNRRNDLETYIFNMRDKISSSGEYGPFISDAARDAFIEQLTKSEDWVYDNMDAKKLAYIEKLDELKAVGDPVVWRSKEDSIRGDWIAALKGTVKNYREVCVNPGEKYGHIAAEKLAKIAASCDEAEKWIDGLAANQAKLPKCEKPVLICADIEKKNQELASAADEVLKEPKPAPPKEEKPEDDKMEEKAEGEGAAADAKDAGTGNPEGPANMDVD